MNLNKTKLDFYWYFCISNKFLSKYSKYRLRTKWKNGYRYCCCCQVNWILNLIFTIVFVWLKNGIKGCDKYLKSFTVCQHINIISVQKWSSFSKCGNRQLWNENKKGLEEKVLLKGIDCVWKLQLKRKLLFRKKPWNGLKLESILPNFFIQKLIFFPLLANKFDHFMYYFLELQTLKLNSENQINKDW